ncbi:MAG: MBOAT family protein [Deltaproteobacteria bacterium]|nr:MBOAT family protein [Deltaproteobacteria bacterium]
MLFNSLEFLLLFMPVVLIVALQLQGKWLTGWICITSIVFYAYAGHTWFLLPMILSATLDFWVGNKIFTAITPAKKRFFLILSLVANLSLLGYFKYSGLILQSLSQLLDVIDINHSSHIFEAWKVILPAGISFYTFQTISYTMDVYRGHGKKEKDYFAYFAFVSFFPHLVAGPLTRHNQLIPQIKRIALEGINPRWREGIFLFVAGLAKKILIADRIANIIDPIIDNMMFCGFFEAWLAVIGYAMQIYFDFSGYTDMAIGLGRLMNIELPKNFNSPYKALSPSDFWKRWHITLSMWLRDYLYIPLGGNQCSAKRQRINLMLTMMLGGLWHGASWNFLLWGIYHGVLLVIYHYNKRQWDALSENIQIGITFIFICFGWVFFRAGTFELALYWFKALLMFNGVLGDWLLLTPQLLFMVLLAMWIVFTRKNTADIQWKELTMYQSAGLGVVAAVCVLLMNYSSRFLYFQF